MAANDDVSKLKATWDPVAKQIKITEDAVKSLGSVQNELMSDFAKAAQSNIDYYKEVLSHLTEASKEGGDFKSMMERLGTEVDLTSKKMKPVVDYLSQSVAEGKNFKDAVKDLKVEFTEVKDQAGKTVELLESMSKLARGLGAGDLAKLFTGGAGAFKSFQTGFSELSKAASGEVGTGAGLKSGMGGIFSGLEALREITEPFRRGWADVNKQVLDINANIGKLGEYTDTIATGAGNIASKYNMTLDQVMKLDVSLARIGAQHDTLNESVDGILSRYKAMPSLTPEKQVDMMAQYMSRFGMDSAKAGDALGQLFKHAQNIKDTLGITNVSAGEFLERSQSLEIASRSMGYNFGDATARLEIMAKLMKEASGSAIDWEGASKATAAIMSIGQGNLGMQAYMMEQFGGMKGASAQGLVGGYAINPEKRMEGQVGMMEDFMKMTAPSGKKFADMTKEERAGDIILAFKGMGISLNEQRVTALTGAMAKGPEAFHKAMLDETKIATSLREKQKDADKSMGVNIQDLVKVTTTMEDSVVGLLGKIAGTLVDLTNHFLGGTADERSARRERGNEVMRKQFFDVSRSPLEKEQMMKQPGFAQQFESEEGMEELRKAITAPIPKGAGKAANMLRAMEVQIFFKAGQEYKQTHPQWDQNITPKNP